MTTDPPKYRPVTSTPQQQPPTYTPVTTVPPPKYNPITSTPQQQPPTYTPVTTNRRDVLAMCSAPIAVAARPTRSWGLGDPAPETPIESRGASVPDEPATKAEKARAEQAVEDEKKEAKTFNPKGRQPAQF